MDRIQTDRAPAAIGPYSQAVRSGDLIFTSMQLPLDPEANCIPDTIEAQTEQVLSNLRSLAKAAGSDLDHTVKVTVYLRSIDDFQRMNEVYRNFFKDVPPARGAVEVSRIPKDALVAMEAIFEVLS